MQPPEIPATELAYFDPGDGRRIAYRLREPKAGAPTVLFLPGYASDMEGTKAEGDRRLLRDARAGLPPDRLFGHRLERRRLRRRHADPLAGGSAGGDRHADRRAADRRRLLDGRLAGASCRAEAAQTGSRRCSASPPRPTSPTGASASRRRKRSISTASWSGPIPTVPSRRSPGCGFCGVGRRRTGCSNSPIDLIIPIRLVHGELDEEVPMGVPIKLLADLRSSDVQLRLIKGAGHRLSEPHEIHAILVELVGLVERIVV